jgi:hypothetical protein
LAKSSNDDHRLDCIKNNSLKDYWISTRSAFFVLAKIRQKRSFENKNSERN